MRKLAVVALVAAAVAPSAHAASVAPNPSKLGDLLTVNVPAAARPDFGPFTVVEERSTGDGARQYVIQCLVAACAPDGGARRIALPGLPVVVVLPRVSQRDVARPAAAFRREVTLPRPRYRIDPTLSRGLLIAAALVAAAGALLLLRARRVDRRTALERALALVRASAGRGAQDRRRALDLLARTVADPTLVEVAWAEPEPTADQVVAIADAGAATP